MTPSKKLGWGGSSQLTPKSVGLWAGLAGQVPWADTEEEFRIQGASWGLMPVTGGGRCEVGTERGRSLHQAREELVPVSHISQNGKT